LAGVNSLESMRISDERWYQFQALNHVLLPIEGIISIWQPIHLMIWSVDKSSHETWLVKC
jgi:hypothetical protein